MKNPIRTRIALLVVLMVVALAVAACNRNSNDQEVDTPTPTVQPPATQPPTGGTDTPAQPTGHVFQDPNVTQPGIFPIVYEPITLRIGIAEPVNVSDLYDNDLTRYLQELTGVNIEFVLYAPGGDGTTQISLQVAANEPLPDLIFGIGIGNHAIREQFGMAGAILPLNTFLEEIGYFTNQAISQLDFVQAGADFWAHGRSSDGNIYGWGSYENTFSNRLAARAWYNTEFAAALGMSEDDWTGGIPGHPVPTYEWLLEFLRGVRDNDLTGDLASQIPMTGGTGWRQQLTRWVMQMFIYQDYGSTNAFWLVRDGELDFAFYQPEWREGLRFLNMMFEEGLFHDFSMTQNAAGLSGTVNQQPHRVGIAVSGGFGIYDEAVHSIYRQIPIVEGPGGFISTSYFQNVPHFNWAISAHTNYPEAAFRFLDAFAHCPDFVLRARFGVEGRDWKVADEGYISMFGEGFPIEPYYVQIVHTWGAAVTTAHWQSEFGIDWMNRRSSTAWNPMTQELSYVQAVSSQAVTDMLPYRPTEFPVAINWQGTELADWAETRAMVNSYVEQAKAEFIVGERCVENDWDAYLANLERMGAFRLLEADRAAHRRMTGR